MRVARAAAHASASRQRAPSLGDATVALAVVWTLLALQPFLAPRWGIPAASLVTFAGAAAWLWATRPARRPSRTGPACAELVIGVAAGYASLPAWILASAILAVALGVAPGEPLPEASAPAALLPALLVLGPAFEELLYRERLLGALAARAPAAVALAASSLAFALPHPEPRLRVAAFLVGLGLGLLWLGTRSVALCIGLHAGLNLGIQLAGVPPTRAMLPPAAGAASACVLLGLARTRARWR